jgi:large subunit ribosomal protein L9
MKQKSKKQKYLLLQDVYGLGNQGEISSARQGYFRNYLFPNHLAVRATEHMLRKQAVLQKTRADYAIVAKKESEDLKVQLEALPLEMKVKVDADQRMYGSVTGNDIAHYFNEKGFPQVVRNCVCMLDHTQKARQMKPIKEVGTFKIVLNLKEGVQAFCNLTVIAEGAIQGPGLEKVVQPLVSEEPKTPEETE